MPAAGDQKVRPILGGIKIQSRAPSLLDATLGLVYKEGCFVTAGHAVGAEDSFVGQPDDPSMVGKVISNFLNEGVDMALVQVLVGVAATVNTVWVGEDANQAVTFETKERPEEGELLWIQGAQSGKVQFSVYLTDVDITEAFTGEKVNHVVLLNLDHDNDTHAGDSGAPVVGDGSNLCYGVYGGRVVIDGKIYGWFSPFENLSWD